MTRREHLQAIRDLCRVRLVSVRGGVAERRAAEWERDRAAGDDVPRVGLDPPEPTEDLRRIMRGNL